MKKRLVENHVLCGQNSIVEHLLKTDANLFCQSCNIDEEILEWWLVTPFLAGMLKDEGEAVLEEYDCHWWGRTVSGQAIYMDSVIGRICKRFG